MIYYDEIPKPVLLECFPAYSDSNVYRNITNNMVSELIHHIHNASREGINFYDTEGYIDSIVKMTKATVKIIRLWHHY